MTARPGAHVSCMNPVGACGIGAPVKMRSPHLPKRLRGCAARVSGRHSKAVSPCAPTSE